MNKINNFKGQYGFLSNFYECNITYNDITYKNAEAAFQAQKCLERASEFKDLNGRDARQLGRKVTLRPDWNNVKVQVMKEIIKAKFTQNKDLAEKLLLTGDAELIEGNQWGDTYWGVCNGKGENTLGKILMEIREGLKCPQKYTIISGAKHLYNLVLENTKNPIKISLSKIKDINELLDISSTIYKFRNSKDFVGEIYGMDGTSIENTYIKVVEKLYPDKVISDLKEIRYKNNNINYKATKARIFALNAIIGDTYTKIGEEKYPVYYYEDRSSLYTDSYKSQVFINKDRDGEEVAPDHVEIKTKNVYLKEEKGYTVIVNSPYWTERTVLFGKTGGVIPPLSKYCRFNIINNIKEIEIKDIINRDDIPDDINYLIDLYGLRKDDMLFTWQLDECLHHMNEHMEDYIDITKGGNLLINKLELFPSIYKKEFKQRALTYVNKQIEAGKLPAEADDNISLNYGEFGDMETNTINNINSDTNIDIVIKAISEYKKIIIKLSKMIDNIDCYEKEFVIKLYKTLKRVLYNYDVLLECYKNYINNINDIDNTQEQKLKEKITKNYICYLVNNNYVKQGNIVVNGVNREMLTKLGYIYKEINYNTFKRY